MESVFPESTGTCKGRDSAAQVGCRHSRHDAGKVLIIAVIAGAEAQGEVVGFAYSILVQEVDKARVLPCKVL